MSTSKIHIGFDAKRLFFNQTGLGNYSRTLVKNLQNLSNLRISLFSPNVKDSHRHQWNGISIYSGTGAFYRTHKISNDLEKSNVHIYHGLSQEIPLKRLENIKYVVTIHDMMPFVRPNDFSAIDRVIYRRKVKEACKFADSILAISHNTKEDILKYTDTPEYKIKVIYQSLSDTYFNQQEKSTWILEKFKISKRYILCVGTIERRKNQMALLEALREINNFDLKCVFVSKKNKRSQAFIRKAIDYGLEEKVLLLDGVSDEDLLELYRNALFSVYPSLYEGFGLPIAESLACHCPVITYNNSSLPEAGGPGALYVSNTNEMREALETLMNDADKRSKLSMDGNMYVREMFSPEATTLKLLKVYQRLLFD